MPKSEFELPGRNTENQHGENRFENIHFLVEKINKQSFSGIKYFELEDSKYHTQENLLTYCELLYSFAVQHNDTEVEAKDICLSEKDTIACLAALLEDCILKNWLEIDSVDMNAGMVQLETSLPAFNDMNLYDLNIGFLDFKMNENLKIGMAKCVNKINLAGDLFNHFEIDWVTGEFYDDEDEKKYSKKQLKKFNETLLKYQNKFDKYICKNYNPNKKYTDENDLYIAKIINEILEYNTYLFNENVEEKGNGEAQFDSIFMCTLRDIDEVSEEIFQDSLEARCRALGENGAEYISQFIQISKDSIDFTVPEKEVKAIQNYEKNISDLTFILNNYPDVKKK